MAAGFGVPAPTVIVGAAIAPEIQLLKFGSVGEPLENDGLCPIVPDGCADNHVLVKIDGGVPVLDLVGGFPQDVAVDGGQAQDASVPVYGPVLVGKVRVRDVVVGFMHRKSAGIGMVSVVHAAGCRIKRLWEMRAWAVVIQHGRKYPRDQATGKRSVVVGIDQPLCQQRVQDRLPVRRPESSAMPDTGIRIGDGIESLVSELAALQAAG